MTNVFMSAALQKSVRTNLMSLDSGVLTMQDVASNK